MTPSSTHSRRARPLATIVLASIIASAGCGGGGAEGPAQPATADFSLTCTPASLVGIRCGTGSCTVASKAGFAGDVQLSCSGAPPAVRCGFGPNPVRLPADGTARTGFTLSADPAAFRGPVQLRLVASAGGLDRTFDVSLGSAAAAPAAVSGSLVVYGCAGYTEGIPNTDSLRGYGGTIVGAWRTPNTGPNGGFCREVRGEEADGWFALEVPRSCFAEGADVYLTSGGLPSCVSVPFHAGTVAFAELIGRRASCAP